MPAFVPLGRLAKPLDPEFEPYKTFMIGPVAGLAAPFISALGAGSTGFGDLKGTTRKEKSERLRSSATDVTMKLNTIQSCLPENDRTCVQISGQIIIFHQPRLA